MALIWPEIWNAKHNKNQLIISLAPVCVSNFRKNTTESVIKTTLKSPPTANMCKNYIISWQTGFTTSRVGGKSDVHVLVKYKHDKTFRFFVESDDSKLFLTVQKKRFYL